MELGCAEAAGEPLTGGVAKHVDPPSEAASSFSDTATFSTDGAVREAPLWRKAGLKILCSITCFVAATLTLEHFAEEPVAKVSRQVMEKIGLLGLFAVVLLADGLPQPFTYVPLIFIAVQGAVPKPIVFAVCAAASYSAALCGYAVGACIRRRGCAVSVFTWLQESHPHVPEMLERKGATGVALAALLPVPLALATWTAGSFRVNIWRFLLAGLCRCPKILLFVLLSGSPRQRHEQLEPHGQAGLGGPPVRTVWMTA